MRFDMFNVLGGNWDPTVCLLTVFGHVMQYIQWAGAEGHDPFFTDPDVKQLFKNHIDVMVNRRNTINNRLYKEDPAIFAWDLMNEPRCDCFPDFIPVPESYVSCRPECAKKVQVAVHVMQSSLCCIVLCMSASLPDSLTAVSCSLLPSCLAMCHSSVVLQVNCIPHACLFACLHLCHKCMNKTTLFSI